MIVATASPNRGHTAMVLRTSAQIGSLSSPTSYVRKTLSEIAGDGVRKD
ncbi:hypothetical protein AciM339_1220 [Aciduliprofundum sp. MAR08-339]|nr:hypothetical protein AciM339_1220 [Aciduliprofundum sp. MAR08-339]